MNTIVIRVHSEAHSSYADVTFNLINGWYRVGLKDWYEFINHLCPSDGRCLCKKQGIPQSMIVEGSLYVVAIENVSFFSCGDDICIRDSTFDPHPRDVVEWSREDYLNHLSPNRDTFDYMGL